MRTTRLGLALGLLCACALKPGPGKHNPSLGWKVYSVATPYRASAPAFTGPGWEVRIERVLVVEGRTVVKRYDSYSVMIDTVIINHGDRPLPLSALAGRFRVHAAGGPLRTYENPRGPKASGESNVTGPSWSGPHQAMVLEPGAQGAYGVSASLRDADGNPLTPLALTLDAQRVELLPE